MSLNNSILTKRSKSGEFPAHSAKFYNPDKDFRVVEAVKYYGMQRGRPMFSCLPPWLWDEWTLGRLKRFESLANCLCHSNIWTVIQPGNYIVKTDRSIEIIPGFSFEKEHKPIKNE